MTMRIGLPEIGMGGLLLLVIVGLVGGVLMGTHQPLWAQLGIVIVTGYAIERSDLEMGALAYLPGWVLFIVGCIIGDISWWLQTGGVEVHLPEIGNPFSVK